MSKHNKTKEYILSGAGFANVRYDDLCSLLVNLGFKSKTKASSHVIFTKEGVPEIINLQRGRDGKAKPYQVRQVAGMIRTYKL